MLLSHFYRYLKHVWHRMHLMTSREINSAFLQSCREGDVVQLQKMLSDPQTEKYLSFYDHECFEAACGQGHLKVVQFLVTEPGLKNTQIRIKRGPFTFESNYCLEADWNEEGIKQTIAVGHFPILHYLLTHPHVTPPVHLHRDTADLFLWALEHNQMDIARFLVEQGTPLDQAIHTTQMKLRDRWHNEDPGDERMLQWLEGVQRSRKEQQLSIKKIGFNGKSQYSCSSLKNRVCSSLFTFHFSYHEYAPPGFPY